MEKEFGGDEGKRISARAQKSTRGARVLPAWMVYAREKVRPILEAEASRRPKGPSRHYENTVRSSYEKAVKDFGYEGTEHDWFYLLKYAQFPGDPPNPNRRKKWYHAR